MSNRSLVLVIAGLDSGGGAGITADMLTIHDCGAWGLPCVTALTAQSLKNVTKIQETTLSQFRETLRLAKQDWEKISAAKIGLITHRDILEETLQFLENSDYNIPVVWDPVNSNCGKTRKCRSKVSLNKNFKSLYRFYTKPSRSTRTSRLE